MAILKQAYATAISLLIGLLIARINMSISTTIMSNLELAFVKRFFKAAESNLLASSTTCS